VRGGVAGADERWVLGQPGVSRGAGAVFETAGEGCATTLGLADRLVKRAAVGPRTVRSQRHERGAGDAGDGLGAGCR
jgi:hypothetical protein